MMYPIGVVLVFFFNVRRSLALEPQSLKQCLDDNLKLTEKVAKLENFDATLPNASTASGRRLDGSPELYNVLPEGREPGCFGKNSIDCPNPFYKEVTCADGPCQELNILINNPESGGWPGGGPMKLLTYAMLERINANQDLLPGYDVRITYQDDACNSDQSVKMFSTQLVNNPKKYVAFGGTSCSGTAMATTVVASIFRMPHIGWAPSSPDLSDRVSYPGFFRTRVADTGGNAVWIALLKQFGWNKVGIMWGDTKRFNFHHSKLIEDLNAVSDVIETVFDYQVLIIEADTPAVIKTIRSTSVRVVLTVAYEPPVRAMFCHGLRMGVKGIFAMGVGWYSTGFVQDRTSPDMSGAGHPDFTCTPEEMDDLFMSSLIGTNGVLWSSDMDAPLSCLPSESAQSLKTWFETVSIGGKGYEADGAIFVNQISAGFDGMCTILFMLKRMLFEKGYTLDTLLARSEKTYQEILDVLAATSFNGMSSKTIAFSNGDLDGDTLLKQTARVDINDPNSAVDFVDLGYYKQGVIDLSMRDISWPDGTFGLANAPSGSFPDCPSGTVLQLGTCQSCSAGQIPQDVDGSQQCSFCESGKFSDVAGLTECKSCPAGTKSYDDESLRTACEDCPEGSYTELTSSAKCSSCSTGKYSNAVGVTSCQQCVAGKLANESGMTECALCDSGYECSVAAEFMKPCEKGTIQPQAGQSACSRCDLGRYQDATAQSECNSCGGKGDTLFTTGYPGAQALSDCGCPAGFYKDSHDECQVCPEGMVCGFGSDARVGADVYPVLKPLYWSSVDDPLSVFMCDDEARCPGGDPGVCSANLKGQSCAHCEEGFIYSGGSCTKCASVETTSIFFPILPIVLVPVVVCVIYKFSGDKFHKWDNWRNAIPTIAFIILNHYQILQNLAKAEIVLPDRMHATFSFFAFTSDMETIFKPGCSGFAFQALMTLKVIFPAVYLLLGCLTWAVSQLLSHVGCSSLKMEKNRAFNAVWSMMLTCYAAVVNLGLTIFVCKSNPNGTSSLAVDRSITCYKDQWVEVLAMGIVGVILWVFGVGAVFVWAIVTAPYNMQKPEVQTRWKFLFIKFRNDVCWWSLVFLLKGVLLNLALVVTNGIWQILWIMCTLACYIGGTVVFMPWTHVSVNYFDIGTHVALLFSSACCLVFSLDYLPAAKLESSKNLIVDATLVASLFCLALGALTFASIANRLTVKAISYKTAECTSIVHAVKQLAQCPDEEVITFCNKLCEWDFHALTQAHKVIHTEFAGVRARRGYSGSKQLSHPVQVGWSFQDDTVEFGARHPEKTVDVSLSDVDVDVENGEGMVTV
jgi:hypothetical protein